MNRSASKTLRTPAIGVLLAALFAFGPSTRTGAEVPTTSVAAWARMLKLDFSSIIEIRTIKLDDEPIGPSDWIVSGWQYKEHGLRVEIFHAVRGQLTKKWDSAPFTHGVEFMTEGRPGIQVWGERGHEYGILIEGCARHMCSDGISGYVWFSGQSGKSGRAKVTADGLDKPLAGSQTYQVRFSPQIDEDSKQALEEAICSDSALSNKAGLPFACKAR